MTTSVGASEARTHLSQLIVRAEAGETIIITRRGQAVAQLTPLPKNRPRDGLVGSFTRFRSNLSLGDVVLKDAIAEGRR
jgi:prevent-host-death family protein